MDLPPHAVSFDPEFTRETDIKLNCALAVCKTLVEESLNDALVAAAEKDWKIEGLAVGQRFVVQFTGAGGLAARRAAKLMRSMCFHSGHFARCFVAVEGPGKSTEIHLSCDKAPKTIILKTHVKQMRRA